MTAAVYEQTTGVPATSASTAIAPTTAATVGKWLDEYSELAVILPVLTGLFVTSRLHLRGANALIANLAIAAVSRQVIDQLKQEAIALPSAAPADRAAKAAPAAVAAPKADEDYKIVHSVPGRIRLRIPQLQEDRSFAKRLEKLLLAEDVVTGVRINRAAASVAIQYGEQGLSELELGMRLLGVLERAQTVPESADTTDP
ncbi:MAG: HMA2 domain-containing protein [Cyanobacteria bacterium P01_H01_bin.130]